MLGGDRPLRWPYVELHSVSGVLDLCAAISNSRSEASSRARRSDTSHSRDVTQRPIAGVMRSLPWILMKLQREVVQRDRSRVEPSGSPTEFSAAISLSWSKAPAQQFSRRLEPLHRHNVLSFATARAKLIAHRS